MGHVFSRWVLPLIVVLPIVAGRWELTVLLAGFILTSQSLHESVHHPSAGLAHWTFRITGAMFALGSAILLR